jgi:hypothetical protein
MTSIVMLRQEDRVDLYSDTMTYDEHAVVKGFTPKVFTLLPQHALFGYRGQLVAAQMYHMQAVQRSSFDEILANLKEDVSFGARTAQAMGLPPTLIINLAGWSRGIGGFVLAWCGIDPQKPEPKLELMSSQFTSDPPLPPRSMREIAGETGQLVLEGDATIIRWFEAQRAANYPLSKGHRGGLVGGAIQHTWLTAEGESGSHFIYRWPADVIGKPAQRLPFDGVRDEFEGDPT